MHIVGQAQSAGRAFGFGIRVHRRGVYLGQLQDFLTKTQGLCYLQDESATTSVEPRVLCQEQRGCSRYMPDCLERHHDVVYCLRKKQKKSLYVNKETS